MTEEKKVSHMTAEQYYKKYEGYKKSQRHDDCPMTWDSIIMLTDDFAREAISEYETAYNNQCKRADDLNERMADLLEALKKLIPLAEDGYKLHVKNCSHQEFLNDDRDDIAFAKEQIQKAEQL
jgi:hypothetical protein